MRTAKERELIGPILTWRRRRFTAQMPLFQIVQHLLRAPQHRTRQSRQLCHVDPIRTVGAAGHHFVQENHVPLLFQNVHAGILDARQGALQFSQFVEMRGKEGLGLKTRMVVQVLQHRAGNGQAVVGTGAASNLVENHQ